MANRNISDTVSELRKHILFSALSPEQLALIARHSRILNVTEGEILFQQDQPAERFFRLCSGQIKLSRLSMEGTEHVIEIIHPGQPFAEAVIFMKKRLYPVNAEALMNSRVLAVDSATFLQILYDSRETCFRLMADMSYRLHTFVNEIDNLTLQNATFRLVNHLLRQIADCKASEAYIQLSTSKQVLASRLSIKPETFSRILKTLNQKGLLEVNGSTIHILDVDGLRCFENH
ncbi:MAG TPA: Crp/Fnr family transcriptional regulator [Gammaproteobacteria bacterium]|nr:Crp/Fnr family transcriptional regulator [Gammaproteobacteria bacterium]